MLGLALPTVLTALSSAATPQAPGQAAADSVLIVFEWSDSNVADTIRSELVTVTDPGLVTRHTSLGVFGIDARLKGEAAATMFGWHSFESASPPAQFQPVTIKVGAVENVDSSLVHGPRAPLPARDPTRPPEELVISLFFVKRVEPIPADSITVRIRTHERDTVFRVNPRDHVVARDPLVAFDRSDLTRAPSVAANLTLSVVANRWPKNGIALLLRRTGGEWATSVFNGSSENARVKILRNFDALAPDEWLLYFIVPGGE